MEKAKEKRAGRERETVARRASAGPRLEGCNIYTHARAHARARARAHTHTYVHRR